MLFNAVVMNFTISIFLKILSIRQSVHCASEIHSALMVKFFILQKETPCIVVLVRDRLLSFPDCSKELLLHHLQ